MQKTTISNALIGEEIKELFRMALPHDFGGTLYYMDRKLRELEKLIHRSSPLYPYLSSVHIHKRIRRALSIISEVDDGFQHFWDENFDSAQPMELDEFFEEVFASSFDQMLLLYSTIKNLLDRVTLLGKKKGLAYDRAAQAALEQSYNIVGDVEYFAKRCRYYIKGMVHLMQFEKQTISEPTNLNKFFMIQRDFFAISGAGHRLELLNTLPTVLVEYSHCFSLFSNLIKNSIKYRRGRHVKIGVLYDDSSFAKPELHALVPEYVPVGRNLAGNSAIHFFDFGIGVPESKLERIFLPFKRGLDKNAEVLLQDEASHYSPEEPFSYSGMGIGLAIVKRVVDLYEGKVYANSRLDSGTCITIELPNHLIL